MATGEGKTVRKAVVPAAGLGTRHFPASHAVKKELFPVVGPDGIARALFHYHLLELVAAGIEEICIIVQPGDDKAMRAYLDGPDAAYLKRLAKYPDLAAEAKQMRELGERGDVCRAARAGGVWARGVSEPEIRRRRDGAAVPRRSSFPRLADLAVPGIGRDGGHERREKRLGGQSHRPRRIERLRHHRRQTPRGHNPPGSSTSR